MNITRIFKRVGKVIAAPVVIPARAVKEGVEMVVLKRVLGLVIRHALTWAGGATIAVSDNEIELAVGAIMTLVGLAHSIYEKRAQPQPQ